MRKVISLSLPIFLLITAGLVFAQGEDVPGSKDHPLLSRYPGSYIRSYSRKEYDEYYILLAPVKSTSDRDIKSAKRKRVTGRVTKILYQSPEEKSNLEIFENYRIALEKAGFKTLYEDRGVNLRGASVFLEKVNREYTGGWVDPEIYGPFFYLSASSPDEKTFVSLLVRGSYDGPRVNLSIVEIKGMEKGLITAKEIKSQLSRLGKAVIYGIYFDFDKAEIKPESKPTLREIAKFLKENPEIKLYVVGHTDNVGSLEYNMELSLKRAKAVVDALVKDYAIGRERLRAFGVGFLAPVASNETEEGRAKNRRVELVKE